MDALDVIEWQDTTGTEIVHRWPIAGPGNIRLGSQLTVRESQAAVFFRDGKVLDTFHAGRHTLTTANIPLLQRIINIPFGGETPFQAEVYFVNLRTLTDLKWGTPAPIPFRDKELSMVRLRSFGIFTCRVADPSLFVNKVVGTERRYDQVSVETWMREFIVSRFTDTLGSVLESVLDLAAMYDEIGVATRERCRDDFSKFGIELLDLLIEAITPPEEVQKMIDERTSMEAVGDMGRFTQYRTAQAIGDMAKRPGGGGGGMETGAGLGAGLGIGAAMAGTIRDALTGSQQPAPAQPAPPAAAAAAAPSTKCPKCQGDVPAGAKFCPSCGETMGPAKCSECGAEMPAGAKFCPGCGKKQGE